MFEEHYILYAYERSKLTISKLRAFLCTIKIQVFRIEGTDHEALRPVNPNFLRAATYTYLQQTQ